MTSKVLELLKSACNRYRLWLFTDFRYRCHNGRLLLSWYYARCDWL